MFPHSGYSEPAGGMLGDGTVGAVSNEMGHGGVSAVAIVKTVLEVEENTKRLPIFFTKPEMKR